MQNMAQLLFKTLILSLLACGLSGAGFSDEVSLVKGIYQSNKVKDGITTTIISAGGRYLMAPPRGQDFALFFEGDLGLISYSGTNAPSNTTAVQLYAGVRKYLGNLTENLHPYAQVYGGYLNTNNGGNAVTSTQVVTSGLVYYGAIGLQLASKDGFFIDLETNLFTSYLFATEKDTLNNVTTETSRNELYADTKGSFNTTSVGVGYKF